MSSICSIGHYPLRHPSWISCLWASKAGHLPFDMYILNQHVLCLQMASKREWTWVSLYVINTLNRDAFEFKYGSHLQSRPLFAIRSCIDAWKCKARLISIMPSWIYVYESNPTIQWMFFMIVLCSLLAGGSGDNEDIVLTKNWNVWSWDLSCINLVTCLGKCNSVWVIKASVLSIIPLCCNDDVL